MTKEEAARLWLEAMAKKQEWFDAWERYIVAAKELHDSEIPRCAKHSLINCKDCAF